LTKTRGLVDGPDRFADLSADVLPVQHRYHAGRDIGGTDSLTRVVVGAVAKSFLLHGAHHVTGATLALRLPLGQKSEVRDLGSDEEHRRTVRTGGSTGSATDAGGGIHCRISNRLGNECRGGIGGTTGVLADEATRANDPVVGTPVDHQILYNREGAHAEGLHGDGLPILKLAHVNLTGSSATRPLGNAVDHHMAGSANPLAAIAGKGDRLLALPGQAVVHDIEHLQERSLRGDFRGVNLDKLALIRGRLLLPESEMKIHGAHDRKSWGYRRLLVAAGGEMDGLVV